MIESCETCRFWGEDHKDMGLCRRRAPISIPFGMTAQPDDGLSTRAFWPETQAEEWCGEHEVAEEPIKATDQPPTHIVDEFGTHELPRDLQYGGVTLLAAPTIPAACKICGVDHGGLPCPNLRRVGMSAFPRCPFCGAGEKDLLLSKDAAGDPFTECIRCGATGPTRRSGFSWEDRAEEVEGR